MTHLGDRRKSFAEAEDEFMRAQHTVLVDPLNDVEYLDRAGCGARVQNLARLAIGASSQGLAAEGWRAWITDELGADAEPFLDDAEQCMRVSGLWPWPN